MNSLNLVIKIHFLTVTGVFFAPPLRRIGAIFLNV